MAGIYIHIPFCKSRCKYCDFFSTTQLEKREAYIQAVIQEWKTFQGLWSKEEIRTIYLGGGTPSLLPVESLHQLLHSILSSIHSSSIQEITLEANPGDIIDLNIRVSLLFFISKKLNMQIEIKLQKLLKLLLNSGGVSFESGIIN